MLSMGTLIARQLKNLHRQTGSPDLAVEHDHVDGEKRGGIPEHVADEHPLALEALSPDHEQQGAEHHRADEVAAALRSRRRDSGRAEPERAGAGGRQAGGARPRLGVAEGESVIQCPSPLIVIKGTYDHSY